MNHISMIFHCVLRKFLSRHTASKLSKPVNHGNSPGILQTAMPTPRHGSPARRSCPSGADRPEGAKQMLKLIMELIG